MLLFLEGPTAAPLDEGFHGLCTIFVGSSRDLQDDEVVVRCCDGGRGPLKFHENEGDITEEGGG